MERDHGSTVVYWAGSRGDPGSSVVEATLATLMDIASALTPIIGHQGVAALYKRSLALCAVRHACLADVQSHATNGLDLAPLREVLLAQDSTAVSQCGNDLLKTLNDLLISLIGASLAERLLRCAWENSLCGPPPQDTLL